MALYPEGTSPLPLDDVQRAANKANELGRQALGQNGAIASDGIVTGNFVAVQVITDGTLFDLLDTAPSADFSALLGQAISAGTVLYGPFTAIGSTGGFFVAYKA